MGTQRGWVEFGVYSGQYCCLCLVGFVLLFSGVVLLFVCLFLLKFIILHSDQFHGKIPSLY